MNPQNLIQKWILPLGQIIGIAFLIWLLFTTNTKQDELREYWENKDFKTDSSTVYVDYTKIPKPIYKNYVPPALVINYIDSTRVLNKTSIVMNDSLLLIIDSLKHEITKVSLNYLKLYPHASKLIYGEFNYDSIRLDLLGVDGIVRQNNFGVNYNRFKYQWLDTGGIYATENNRKTARETNKEFYGYSGYDFQLGQPIIGLDYSISRNRFRIKGNTFFPIKNPEFFFQTTLGYRIR